MSTTTVDIPNGPTYRVPMWRIGLPYLVQGIARIAVELVDWRRDLDRCPLCRDGGTYVAGALCGACRRAAGVAVDPFAADWPYRAYA